MAPGRCYRLVAAAFLALTPAVWSQRSYDWRSYKFLDGLPESACHSVFIVPPGRILAGHANQALATELDGYSNSTSSAPAQVFGRICQSPSGQLWSVAPEGLLSLREGRWVIHPVNGIAEELRSKPAVSVRSLPIYPVRQDHVIYLLHDRLMVFTIEGADQIQTTELCTSSRMGIGNFSGFAIAPEGGVWLAGERGIAKTPEPVRHLNPDSKWHAFIPPDSLPIRNLREPLADGAGGVTLLADSADGRPLAVFFDGQRWTTWPMPAENILCAWRGSDLTFWAMTPESLFSWDEPQTLTTNQDIFTSEYYDVAVEPGGVFWLATAEGLFRHTPLAWRKPVAVRDINSPVIGLTEDAAGRLWFVANNRLHALKDDLCSNYPLPSPFRSAPAGHVLFPLRDGSLLLDAGGRLLRFNPVNGSFNTVPPREAARHTKILGLLADGSVCFQKSTGGNIRLESFDGTDYQPLPNPPEGLGPTENITAFYAARSGDLWLGSEVGVIWLHDKKWRRFDGTDRSTPASAVCFIELADGKIWCATPREIWEFDGRDWSLLRAGFDRINGLHQGRDGSIWIASNNGLFRYYQGAWLENTEEEGLPDASIREVCGDVSGRVWAATPHGLSLYHPEADPDPPKTFILPPPDGRDSISEGGSIELVFNGTDKWKQTPRRRLLYSYRLDEKEWSPFHETTSVSFNNLSPGKHFFQARAMDGNGNIDPAPPILEFVVPLPWYKETRLLLIALFGMGAALFFAALAINRHRQLRRSYAEVERKVAERTRELEIASRELLHSQKMNALGALAAGIAHDFNNILSIIKGSAQIIEDNLDNPQKIRTRVDRIKTVVEQGSGIVKAMLGFSRNSDGQPARCDPNEVVADTVKLLGDRFLREVEVRFEPVSGLPPVSVSKDFVQQILLNFIFNAAEAMSGEKHIFLAAQSARALPPGLALAPAEAAEYISFTVRDSGCGIPPENLPRIFEPFFTTKAFSTRRGTGLGLSMAYELAKKLEAGLAVESAVGQGSTFTLILPVREAATEVKAR